MVAAVFIAFWGKGDLSRTFVVLELACSVIALLAASGIMRKVHGEGEPPRAERAR